MLRVAASTRAMLSWCAVTERCALATAPAFPSDLIHLASSMLGTVRGPGVGWATPALSIRDRRMNLFCTGAARTWVRFS